MGLGGGRTRLPVMEGIIRGNKRHSIGNVVSDTVTASVVPGDEHSLRYREVEALRRTPETSVTVCQLDSNKNKGIQFRLIAAGGSWTPASLHLSFLICEHKHNSTYLTGHRVHERKRMRGAVTW